MNYISVKSAAKKWNLTERRVTALCRNGRIENARKENGLWLIPDNATKPIDGRTNKFSQAIKVEKKLPLPIGITDYKELVSNYYYVDKTLLLKEFLDYKPKVSLFARPRRFGKTLTMNMIKTFFEISQEDNSIYFKDKNIYSCGKQYQDQQGKYPVIFITFKDVKYSSWQDTYQAIKSVIANEYMRHDILLTSEKCNDYDKKYFVNLTDKSINEVDLANSLQELSRMLKKHYDQPAIIIIDEYDTPIQQGYSAGFYQEVTGFMRNLLSGAFKDNPNLSYGFLTGILRIAKESIFSGLNNLKVHSILDEQYDEYFGFSKEEVKEMANYYDVLDKYEEICDWYDGYRFGDKEIFNPWSVINYFSNNCKPQAYWISTADNSIIRQIVSQADSDTTEGLRQLLQGKSVSSYVDISLIYPEIKSDPTTIYSFLLSAGYLKIIKKELLYDGNCICEIAIPNKEINFVYQKEILSSLSKHIPQPTVIAIQKAINSQDVDSLEKSLQKLLLNCISSFDYAHENFYHGLLLGICAILTDTYYLDSNKESGLGRYDIQLKPINKNLPGIIIEIKALKNISESNDIDQKLLQSAQTALNQIEEKQYVTEMKKQGISHFLKIGIALYKKQIKLLSKSE